MLTSQGSDTAISLMLLEGGLTLIAVAVPFAIPGLGAPLFAAIERTFARLARRRNTAVASVGLAALLLRLALLPFIPIPLPYVPDDFSFLLAANTFALGRLTNPTPAMWMHFESIHISMQPTYMSMYFPAVGLLLAAAKVLLGNPWFGILIASAAMCAALCWMLQAWLPPTWALLGGILAILRLGLFSYWINTYSAGGSLAALGGALVLGSLPRLTRTPRTRYGILLALGITLLALTRPYEGVLLCLPVIAYLGHWLLHGKNRPSAAKLVRLSALPLAILIAAGSWLAYYDYRAFGKPTTLPYTVNRAAYAVAPYYVWQSARPAPVYNHEVLRTFYFYNELSAFKLIHKPSGFLPQTFIKILRSFEFYAGIVMLLPLVMIRRVFRDRRIRFLVQCVLVLAAGMVIEIFLIPHYLAPFTAAFYAIGLQCMRHLRLWKSSSQRALAVPASTTPAGTTMVRLIVAICVLLACLRPFAGPLHLALPEWPASAWADRWYGPDHFGTERARVLSQIEHLPGPQLILVRYTARHNPLDEWVYNAPDIDTSKVVWAREMDAAHNLELMHYYPDRKVWLVEPDSLPAVVSPYPDVPQQTAGLR
jgi:hypothetical protein